MDQWNKLAEGLLPCSPSCMKDDHWHTCPWRYRSAVAAKLREMGEEVEWLGSAISETLSLADFLTEAAARGAGFDDHWGERVTQAVEPLRDVKVFRSQTLQHNQVLLRANSKFLRERDEARAERDAALVKFSAADAMAKIVDDWVKRKVIDSRSELADARLDYGEPYKYEAKENAAYLKGLEVAQKITARYKFRIGTLEYPNLEAVEAIQSKIDEAKGK